MIIVLYRLKNSKNEWLYSYEPIEVVGGTEKIRMYDNRVIDICYTFLSEHKIFLENMINLGLKVFFIETLPNHNLKLTDDDFEFFRKRAWDRDFIEKHKNNVKGYEMPQVIRILRENQVSDLTDFYDKLIAESLFVISKLTDQLYHFNMVVCVKSELELQNFLKKDFKIIKIKKISNIVKDDLSYDWMDSTFNFKDLEKFKNAEVIDSDYDSYNFFYRNVSTQEKINFTNYENYCMSNNIDISNNPIYSWYKTEFWGKVTEMKDPRFIFLNECKTFGWLWFYLNYQFGDCDSEEDMYDYTPLINANFIYIPSEDEVRPFAIVDSQGNQKKIPDYEFNCVVEVIHNISGWGSPFTLNEINVLWKKYGTPYKQRLLYKNLNLNNHND